MAAPRQFSVRAAILTPIPYSWRFTEGGAGDGAFTSLSKASSRKKLVLGTALCRSVHVKNLAKQKESPYP